MADNRGDEVLEVDVDDGAEKCDQVPKKRSANDDGDEPEEGKKRSIAWKQFHKYRSGDRPRAKCNWCPKTYACHTKNNGTKSMLAHLEYGCLHYPGSKKYMGPKQKILGFEPVQGKDGETTVFANLVPTTFNVNACKKALAKMIIMDELPFAFVEGEGFKQFMRVAQPKWIKMPGRITIAKHCMAIFSEEKKALKKLLMRQRVCLTTDTWVSIQNLDYMVLTAHFIDTDWNYQKRVINFCVVPNHKGVTLGKIVEKLLLDWGIDKIFTITVDNASSNNLLVDYLKKNIKNRKTTILDHEFLHVRCCAHILNLIVTEGLKEIDVSIIRVRNIVRYVRSSPVRMGEFWSCVEREKIECRLKPCLDVTTRWNYTYFMLERALVYRKAFERLSNDTFFKVSLREDEVDKNFDDVDFIGHVDGNENDEFDLVEFEKAKGRGKGTSKGRGRGFALGPPNADDWKKVKLYVKFLKMFYKATLRFSGSLHVTCNEFFDQIVSIQGEIIKTCGNSDLELYSLASGMRSKFEKYWGKFEKINQVLLYAVVLDPRYKTSFVDYCLKNSLNYHNVAADEMIEKLKGGLTRLFEWYVKHDTSMNVQTKEGGDTSSKEYSDGDEDDDIDSHVSLTSQFKMHVEEEINMVSKSELEKILAEPRVVDGPKFELLTWWKLNSDRYPILSQVARDVLAVPVSTVASESAFSTGGRVLDLYRSSLSPKTVEALICTQQWLRKSSQICIKEQLNELEEMDSVLNEAKDKESSDVLDLD